MANLILTICSNHKRGGGRAYDANACKIADLLPNMKHKIYSARLSAWNNIIKNRIKRDDTPLMEMSYNEGLVKGPDIRVGEKGKGRYLPAQKRYDGRFYKALGESVGDQFPLKVGAGFENHFLIVSGLYGVLTPTEPIQRYSCNVQDEPDIRKRWKKADDSGIGLLTRILIAYIQRFDITRVFDLMGDDSYRHLVDWDAISHETGSTIFYAHSEQQQGADMLLELGNVAGLLLGNQPANNLSTIKSGDVVDGITFDKHPPEWVPCGAVSKKWTAFAAWVVSMEVNIGTFLSNAGVPEKYSGDFISLKRRIRKLNDVGEVNQNIVKTMDSIREFRNRVIHESWLPDAGEAARIRRQYKIIADWARERGYGGLAKLKDVDY